jgi:hypothetical protein
VNTDAVAAALEQLAAACHNLARTLRQPDDTTDRQCHCGAAVTYREWTSQAGKHCRAWKCEHSKQGEDHYIEWAKPVTARPVRTEAGAVA